MTGLDVEVNYACSFGPSCHAANILKRNNIKVCSYPFDWIFSNPDIISHCVEDGFKNFLDKTNYATKSKWQCKNTYYNKKKVMFNHYNPLINEAHYDYYVRCVDRFKDLLKKKEHKLFVMLVMNKNDFNDSIKNDIIKFNDKFSNHTSNYTLLVICNVLGKKENNHKFTYSNNIHFLELDTLSSSQGSWYENQDDNIYLDNLIKSKYNFNIINGSSVNNERENERTVY
jgi:hypothetical protein